MNDRWREHIRWAPELALLPVLERCLDALALILKLEHPTLADLEQPADPPTLRRARRLRRAAHRLQRAVKAYRSAEARLLRADPDDLPF